MFRNLSRVRHGLGVGHRSTLRNFIEKPWFLTPHGSSSQISYEQRAGLRLRSKFAYAEGTRLPDEDYSEVPEYPALNPETKKYSDNVLKKLEATAKWERSITNAPTVEEKAVLLNSPRKYGWRGYQVNDDFFDYDSQDFYNFITRTFVVKGNALPSLYDSPELNEKVKYFAEKVREPLLECIQFEVNEFKRVTDDNMEINDFARDKAFAETVVNQVNRVLLAVLGSEVDHLRSCQVDYKANVEAFWHVGGLEQSYKEKKFREKHTSDNIVIKSDSTVERAFQYVGNPIIQIRCQDPIANFLPPDHQLCLKNEEVLDRYPYTPQVYSVPKKLRYASIVPGHWSGDKYNNSHLSIHSTHQMFREEVQRSQYYMDDIPNMLNSQAVLASFSKLYAQAFYYGFDQFSGLQYPFSTQTILTNGLNWSFYAYQLNTNSFNQKLIAKNKRQNICWGTKAQNILVEKTSETDQAKVNEDCLKNILLFYLNPPQEIQIEDKTPNIKYTLQEWDDELIRETIWYNMRKVYSQHLLETAPYPEIHPWEWIYKIKHKTRPMDPRRLHYELPDADPYLEPLKLYNPRWKPKGLMYMEVKVQEREEKEKIEKLKKEKKSIRIDKYYAEEYPVGQDQNGNNGNENRHKNKKNDGHNLKKNNNPDDDFI